MIGWLVFLAALLLILLMPCGVYVAFNSAGFVAKLILGPFRFSLLPSKSKKTKKNDHGKSGSTTFESHERVKEQRRIFDFWPLIKLIFELLADFKRKLIINELQFRVVLGGGDPYQLSLNYGRYWAALGNIVPHIDSWFTIRKRDLEIECDYISSSTRIDAKVDLRMSLLTLLHIVLHHGIRILIKYFNITKQTKDGAVS